MPGLLDAARDRGATLERLAREALGLGPEERVIVLRPSEALRWAVRGEEAHRPAPRHLCFQGRRAARRCRRRARSTRRARRAALDARATRLPTPQGRSGARPARASTRSGPRSLRCRSCGLRPRRERSFPLEKEGVLVVVHRDRGRLVTGEHARAASRAGASSPWSPTATRSSSALEVREIETRSSIPPASRAPPWCARWRGRGHGHAHRLRRREARRSRRRARRSER